jgi:distribution and morphology protein 31
MTNMSANLGRRLYSHIWDAANPLLGRIRINRISPDASRSLLDGLWSNNSRRISTLPRKPSHLTRRFASGSFFVLGVSPTSTAAESTACILPSRKIAAQYLWKRSIHTPPNDRHGKETPHNTQVRHENDHPKVSQPGGDTSTHSRTDRPPSQHPQHSTPLNRPLIDRLPHMPHLHRPSKEELLAAATGFWSRLKVRFKWFSIRSVRPFSLDEIAALFSWVLLGHIVWVVVGTTTFFSLLILAINTVFAQGKSSS